MTTLVRSASTCARSAAGLGRAWLFPTAPYGALTRYLVSLVAATAALLVAAVLWPALGAMTVPILLAATTLSAWVGGVGPGVTATALAALGLGGIAAPASLAPRMGGMALFALVSLAMIALAAERRRAEANAHEAHAFLQSTLDSLGADVAVVDGAGTIIAANGPWRLAAAVAGGAPGAPGDVGASYLDAWTAPGAGAGGAAVRASVLEVLRGRRPALIAEVAMQRGGERRWFEVRARVFEGAGAVRAVVSHEDVTERKHAAEVQRRAQMDESIVRLARAAAHEINNPLAILLGNVEFVADDLPPASRARVRPMLDAIERIRGVVSRLSRRGDLAPYEPWPGTAEMLDVPRPDTARGVR